MKIDKYKFRLPTNPLLLDGSNKLAKGLIGYFMFNDVYRLADMAASGIIVRNAVKNNKRIQDVNSGAGAKFFPTYGDFRVNGGIGLYFNSASGQLTIPESGFINLSPISVSCWYYHNGNGEGGIGNIIHKGNRWAFYTSTGGAIAWFRDYATTDLSVISNAGLLNTTRWNHVACVWPGGTTATDTKLYVNGLEVSGYATQTNGAGGLSSDSGITWRFGNNAADSNTLNGAISNFKIWNRTLTSKEIKTDFDHPFGLLYKRPDRRLIFPITASSSQSSIATPNVAYTSLRINTPSVQINASSSVSTLISRVSLTAFSPTVVISKSSSCAVNQAVSSLAVYSPTINISGSQVVSPQTCISSLNIYQPTVSVSTGQSNRVGVLIVRRTPIVSPSFGVDFDGVDDSIDCGSGPALDNLTTHTIFAIFKARTLSASLDEIVSKYGSTNNQGPVFMELDNTGKITNFWSDGGAGMLTRSISGTINTNTWYRALITYDNTEVNAKSRIYINGTEVSYDIQQNASFGLQSDASNNFQIGKIGISGGQRYFDGIIAEVAIWNKVLDSGSIEKLSKYKTIGNPLYIYPANLRGYWSLSDYSSGVNYNGRIFRDLSKYRNHGTGTKGTSGLRSANKNSYPLANRLGKRVVSFSTSQISQTITVTPSSSVINIQVFHPTVSVSGSQSSTVTPNVAVSSITVSSPTTTFYSNNLSTPQTAVNSLIVNQPTVQINASQTVSPNVSTVTILVNQPTVSSGGSQSSTTNPGMSTVSFQVNSPNVVITSSTVCTPGLALTKIVINQPTVITGSGTVATPNLAISNLVVNSPTTSVVGNRIVNPTRADIRVLVFEPTTTSGVTSNITIYIVAKSKIEKTINANSQIDKTILNDSRIEKYLTLKSGI